MNTGSIAALEFKVHPDLIKRPDLLWIQNLLNSALKNLRWYHTIYISGWHWQDFDSALKIPFDKDVINLTDQLLSDTEYFQHSELDACNFQSVPPQTTGSPPPIEKPTAPSTSFGSGSGAGHKRFRDSKLTTSAWSMAFQPGLST